MKQTSNSDAEFGAITMPTKPSSGRIRKQSHDRPAMKQSGSKMYRDFGKDYTQLKGKVY